MVYAASALSPSYDNQTICQPEQPAKLILVCGKNLEQEKQSAWVYPDGADP